MRTIHEECDYLLREATVLQKGFARKFIIAWCIWAFIGLLLLAGLIYAVIHFVSKFW